MTRTDKFNRRWLRSGKHCYYGCICCRIPANKFWSRQLSQARRRQEKAEIRSHESEEAKDLG